MADKNPFAKLKMKDTPAKDNPPKFASPAPDPKAPPKEKSPPNGGIEIKDKVKVDFEPVLKEMLGEAVEEFLEGDFTDLEEHTELLEEFINEFQLIGEDLSAAQRTKKRLMFRRYKSKIKIARARSMKRRATTKKITHRARTSAILNMKRRFAGGRNPAGLSVSEKNRVERMVKRRKNAITRSTRKLVRVKRQLERQRLQGRRR